MKIEGVSFTLPEPNHLSPVIALPGWPYPKPPAHKAAPAFPL